MKVSSLQTMSALIGLFFFSNMACISAQASTKEMSDSSNVTKNFTQIETPIAMPMVDMGAEGNETRPHLIVTNAMQEPCLLATINATLRISYRVRPSAVEETYIAITDVALPDYTGAVGDCGRDTVTVTYNWDNSTFHIDMIFTLKEMTKEQAKAENATANWSLTDIEVKFDLANEEAFPGTKASKMVAVSRHDLDLFDTPSDRTMLCESEISVQVGHDEPGVELIFNNVEIAAFGVTSEEFPEQVEICQDKSFLNPDEDIVVPLIVACTLSVVVVLVVIAYAISRKIQDARDQNSYKPMP